MLDHALKLAAAGLRVFPIAENAKKPPIVDDFPATATTDEQQIRRWWAWRPRANIGISTNGMAVIDIDPKRDGLAALAVLEAENGLLPATMRVRTPSGGLHLYLRADSPVANKVDWPLRGIDVRGEGGYVLGPGSVIDGKRYEEIEE